MDVTQTFQQMTAGMKVAEDFVFGTGPLPSSCTATQISNLIQLGQYFNPQADNNGTTLINSQVWGIFQSFNAANFVFGDNNLALTATQDAGFSVTPVALCGIANIGAIKIDGATKFALTAFNYPSTAALPQAATYVAIQYCGLYFINSVNGTTLATCEITLSPALGTGTGVLNTGANTAVFLNVGASSCTSVSGTTITASAPPAIVQKGWFMFAMPGWGNPTWDAPSTVQSISGGTIVVDHVPSAVSAGCGLLFVPPTRSAQLWRRNYVWPGFGGVKQMALRAVLRLPASNGLVSGWTAASPPPANAASGAWPGLWMFSGTSRTENGVVMPDDYSEIDILEMQFCNTQGPNLLSGDNHGQWLDNNGGLAQQMIYLDGVLCGSGSNAWQCMMANDLTATDVSVGLVCDDGQVMHYINDVPWRLDNYRWSSNQPPQYGFQLACGSIQSNFAANLFFPLNSAQFPMSMQIFEVAQYTA